MAASTPELPVGVELRPLTAADAEAHCAGEDDLTVRWLTGGYGDVPGTIAYFSWLADNEAAGAGKRGYGVWLDDRLAGYVDFDPEHGGDLGPGEVNLSYAVHPWARGRGVAVAAVVLICDRLRASGIGARAVIRVEPENVASVRVAEKAGFRLDREIASATDEHADGSPKTMRVYVLDL